MIETSLGGTKNVFTQETLWSNVETSQFKQFLHLINFVSRSRIIQSLQPFFDLMPRDWPTTAAATPPTACGVVKLNVAYLTKVVSSVVTFYVTECFHSHDVYEMIGILSVRGQSCQDVLLLVDGSDILNLVLVSFMFTFLVIHPDIIQSIC